MTSGQGRSWENIRSSSWTCALNLSNSITSATPLAKTAKSQSWNLKEANLTNSGTATVSVTSASTAFTRVIAT